MTLNLRGLELRRLKLVGQLGVVVAVRTSWESLLTSPMNRLSWPEAERVTLSNLLPPWADWARLSRPARVR